MMVEFLYPELTNLLGENGSLLLLTQIFGEDQVLSTSFPQKPRFLEEKVNLVYMGNMTEEKQKLILELFLPYKEEIKEKIEEGQFFLFTGNALDLLGTTIEHEEGETLEALGLFDFKTKVAKYKRTNAFIHGQTQKGAEVFGFISQFTSYQGEMPPLVQSQGKGYGIHYKNLYATSLLGPLLITSPYFTKELLQEMGMPTTLPKEESMMAAFKRRKEQLLENTR